METERKSLHSFSSEYQGIVKPITLKTIIANNCSWLARAMGKSPIPKTRRSKPPCSLILKTAHLCYRSLRFKRPWWAKLPLTHSNRAVTRVRLYSSVTRHIWPTRWLSSVSDLEACLRCCRVPSLKPHCIILPRRLAS